MRQWGKLLAAAVLAAPLTSCFWGPGKFVSDLVLKKDGTFTLDYKGELMIQLPPDSDDKMEPWNDKLAVCFRDGRSKIADYTMVSDAVSKVGVIGEDAEATRPCTAAEIAKLRRDYEKSAAEHMRSKRKADDVEMARALGLPGLDEDSNRAFAAKLAKYAGWRSVVYKGKGVYDVDYHFEGSAKQDFLFPALPDNDFLIPFVALRRRTDGSVLVTAPAFTGGSGPLSARAGAAATQMKDGPVSHASGRFTVITNGEILTNNSEDGPQPHAMGRQVHWDVNPSSTKIPETLVKL